MINTLIIIRRRFQIDALRVVHPEHACIAPISCIFKQISAFYTPLEVYDLKHSKHCVAPDASSGNEAPHQFSWVETNLDSCCVI